VEQRYDAVLAVIRDGMRVTEVAEKFCVHRDTVHSWLARYEIDGLEGLRDRSHRPPDLTSPDPRQSADRLVETDEQTGEVFDFALVPVG
jgi:transposase